MNSSSKKIFFSCQDVNLRYSVCTVNKLLILALTLFHHLLVIILFVVAISCSNQVYVDNLHKYSCGILKLEIFSNLTKWFTEFTFTSQCR